MESIPAVLNTNQCKLVIFLLKDASLKILVINFGNRELYRRLAEPGKAK